MILRRVCGRWRAGMFFDLIPSRFYSVNIWLTLNYSMGVELNHGVFEG
jgi:hypothetical protein